MITVMCNWRVAAAIIFVAVASLAFVESASAQERGWLVGGYLTVGNAWDRSSSIYGSWGAAVEAEGLSWAPRLTYEKVGVGRSCKLSLPPQCSVDVPGGRLLVFGLSRKAYSADGVRVLVRPEAGVAFWTNNAEDASFSEFVAGATAELRISVGSGAFSVGGAVRASSPATMVGAFAGLAIRP
jgi:hypothetical protein